MDIKKELIAQVLIIGEAQVGKTSILTRFTDGNFTENLMPTLGIDYRIKKMEIEGKQIKLQIWDTAGQQRFRAITQNFYKGAMGIILVFDLNDPTSFSNISNWLQGIQQYSGSEVCQVLLGNKCDIEQKVTQAQIDRLITDIKIPFYATSAQTDRGIQQAFQYITKQINQQYFNNSTNTQDSILENSPTLNSNNNNNNSNTNSKTLNTKQKNQQKDGSCC